MGDRELGKMREENKRKDGGSYLSILSCFSMSDTVRQCAHVSF